MLKNPLTLILFSVIIISLSLCFDVGNDSWVWFQRSGSLVTVFGAILGVRSFIRLGSEGIGGATPFAEIGTCSGSRVEDGKVLVSFQPDDECIKAREEDRKDKVSVIIGLIHLIIGTVIWGYGDLLGRIFQ